MNNQKGKLILIKTAYWLGIIADAIWAVGMLFPQIFGILTRTSDFNYNLQFRWAVRKPVERRFIILLTAFLVVGLFIVALIGYLEGNTSNIWILIKTPILFIFMITSFFMAKKMDNPNNRNIKY